MNFPCFPSTPSIFGASGLWYPGIHRAVAEALDTGSCQGVEATMGDLKSSVDYLGHCCASKKSVCEELWLLFLANYPRLVAVGYKPSDLHGIRSGLIH